LDGVVASSAVQDMLMTTVGLLRDMASKTRVHLSELKDFGANPGSLKAKYHVPKDLAPGAPLVVALHGSLQTADDYANGTGWSHFSDRHKFALLLPEQTRANNALASFSWFQTDDIRRDNGEALSIRQMIDAMVGHHHLDPARVFITGLSSGGAMSLVMLAAYPEVFAGGAVIAGLPYGCANGAYQAIDRMHGLGGANTAALEAKIRAASPHQGPWPTLSIWHGSADRTVSVENVGSILGQWSALHGLPPEPTRQGLVEGFPRRVWCDATGREVVEVFSITGMGHGTPIETLGEDSVGVSGIYMLDMHISSTRHIARFWGLVPLAPAPVAAATPQQDDAVAVGKASDLAAGATDPPSEAAKPPIRVPEKVAAQAGGLGSGFEETLRFQMGLTFQLLDAWARWWSLSMKPHARITELPE
jgi:poly(hydroxyalkanoate) depolymerase family esterase